MKALGPEVVVKFMKVSRNRVQAGAKPCVRSGTDLCRGRRRKQVIFSVQLVYTFSIAFTKLSILELYRSLFPTRFMTVACYIAGAMVVSWMIATACVTVFLCHPVAYNWDTSIPGGGCGNTPASWMSTGIVNIITDLVVLAIPVRELVHLQMATYKKIVLIIVFALGIV